MTPQNTEKQVELQESKTYKTYKLDLENKRIAGIVDGYDSIVQNVLKTLLTERYAYEIYTSDIGVEFDKYVGQDFDYIKTDIKKSIQDALSLDERITNVQDIKIEKTSVDTMTVDIIVDTIEGQITLTREVNI